MRTYRFRVDGEPVPQPRPRVTTRNGMARAYVPASHPIHVYRQAVALCAKATGVPCSKGDVHVELECVFTRPPSHLRKRGGLTSVALPRPSPDTDNLYKGVADALQGIAYENDSQVVTHVVSKRYAVGPLPGHTFITLRYVGGEID